MTFTLRAASDITGRVEHHRRGGRGTTARARQTGKRDGSRGHDRALEEEFEGAEDTFGHSS